MIYIYIYTYIHDIYIYIYIYIHITRQAGEWEHALGLLSAMRGAKLRPWT